MNYIQFELETAASEYSLKYSLNKWLKKVLDDMNMNPIRSYHEIYRNYCVIA